MKHLPMLAAALLAAALLSPALAQDNEAEKLFRGMEKKIKEAPAFEVSFAYQVEKKKTTGSLLLTNDNKARLKVSGFQGKAKAGFESIGDGKRLKTKGARFFVQSNGQSGL